MRKNTRVLTSLFLLCSAAMLWVGCSGGKYNSNVSSDYNDNSSYAAATDYSAANDCCEPACPPACEPPRCPPPCAPVCDPCGPEPLCKVLPKCCHPHSNELCCLDGITVTARNPEMCMLGDQYPLEFDVRACDSVCDVVVHTTLPDGVTYVRSQPEATVEGRRVTWNFGHMAKGQCLSAKIWVRCECEGEQCACFCASASPVRFCSLLCAKPILVCHKCGPEECVPGDPIHYTVTVTNRGSCTATGVVVTDNVPEGLEHASGLRTLTFNLGCLEPCQTKKINMCFTAVRRGEICNTATVTACNADPTSCTSKCIVCAECAECVKVGPKEVAVGKNADYTITVTNTGDKPLTEVTVTDHAPNATSIVAAPGAKISGNQAQWRVKQLNAGEKATFNISLTTCTPGCFTNRVSMVNCQGCNRCCEFTTRWKGRPALAMCVTGNPSPICIGEPVTYNVEVNNQGSESDQNVVVVVRFPSEIVPESIAGEVPGKISGNTVTFEPYNNFAPRQTIRLRINARGKASGDGRVVVEVSSDSIKKPIVQQESTIVN